MGNEKIVKKNCFNTIQENCSNGKLFKGKIIQTKN